MLRTYAQLSPFFFNDTATTEIYTLSLHDALPICFLFSARAAGQAERARPRSVPGFARSPAPWRSEEHTSELQSHLNLVCRLLLEKKNFLARAENSFDHTKFHNSDLFFPVHIRGSR